MGTGAEGRYHERRERLRYGRAVLSSHRQVAALTNRCRTANGVAATCNGNGTERRRTQSWKFNDRQCNFGFESDLMAADELHVQSKSESRKIDPFKTRKLMH
ncbi:hypothetical protein LSTR_LSTR017173 [Laodelphax striatellus]|uniref:Uncharacterized protein n=1 Tax=Laodelphax striatellus TaxID=195883 RepID=A0A482WZ51_LAOST|nr:hypothetical protein LSTR_LSTR017173 [Laodelphax striatellus]